MSSLIRLTASVIQGKSNPDAPRPILVLDQVSAGYGTGKVLDGLSLSVAAGSSVAILGRNGMGKTTLLTTLMGLTRQHSGRIILNGSDLSGVTPWHRARLGLGWTPQERAVFSSLTVHETLDIVARKGEWTRQRVYECFPRLHERRNHHGNQLSGGEQQMLAIARALMLNPRVLLLDEPLEGLAPQIVQELLETLSGLVSETGLTTLIVEQNPDQILPLTSHAIILERGQLVYQDDARSLLQDTAAQQRWLGLSDH